MQHFQFLGVPVYFALTKHCQNILTAEFFYSQLSTIEGKANKTCIKKKSFFSLSIIQNSTQTIYIIFAYFIFSVKYLCARFSCLTKALLLVIVC